MSEFSRLLRVARTDFSYFFRTKWLMALLISLNLSDMLITALVYKRLIGGFDYFRFLVPGIVLMGLFSAATDTGRRIWLALREGVVQYYLTLPIRTFGLVLAYILSGGLAGTVYASTLLVVASVVLPPQGRLNILAVLPFLFILSTGIAGLAALLASLSRQGEVYWAYAQALQVSLVTLSTIFYPASVIASVLPGPVAAIAQGNPLSLAAQMLRDSVFGGSPLDFGLLGALLATSFPLVVMGVLAYWVILRRIRLWGKPRDSCTPAPSSTVSSIWLKQASLLRCG